MAKSSTDACLAGRATNFTTMPSYRHFLRYLSSFRSCRGAGSRDGGGRDQARGGRAGGRAGGGTISLLPCVACLGIRCGIFFYQADAAPLFPLSLSRQPPSTRAGGRRLFPHLAKTIRSSRAHFKACIGGPLLSARRGQDKQTKAHTERTTQSKTPARQIPPPHLFRRPSSVDPLP